VNKGLDDNQPIATCSHGGIYSVNPKLVRVDFSSNVNPLGISRRVLQSIQNATRSLVPVYPDPDSKELKERLAHYLFVSPQCITVGNGATEIIYMFAQAFVGMKRVVIPVPTFCEYELASHRSGAKVSFVPLQRFELDKDLIIEKAKGADAVFLCNPNNPTGTLDTVNIKKIIEGISSKDNNRKTKILLDECFIELIDEPSRHTMLNRLKEFESLIILRSLTKSYGLAGLRLGYSICSPALAKHLAAAKIPWNVNGLAQVAGIAALQDPQHVKKAVAIVKREREFMLNRLRARIHSFIAFRSEANFFLIQLKNGNSTKLRDDLLRKSGVLVRDCSTFTGMGSRYVRVAIRTHRENLILLNALESAET